MEAAVPPPYLAPGRDLRLDLSQHARAYRGDAAVGPGREPLPRHPGGSAAQIPAGQSRRAAALHRAAGGISVGLAGVVALALFCHWPVARRLRRDPPFRLEPAGLSRRQSVVLQSHGLAGRVLHRRRAGGGGAPACLARSLATDHFLSRPALPCLRRLYRLVLAVQFAGAPHSGLVCPANLPDRQDEPPRPETRSPPRTSLAGS